MPDEILDFIREQQSSPGAAEKFAVIDERNRDREIEEFIREQKTRFRGVGNMARGVGQAFAGDLPAGMIAAGGMAADAASQLGPTDDPGVLSRRQGGRGAMGNRMRGGTDVLMDELPETPQKFWEVMRDPDAPTRAVPDSYGNQAPTPITRAAVGIAERWRKEVAEVLPYERSTGMVAGFVEDTLRSAPTTAAGAGLGLAVGAVTRNPAAGLSAGSIFMALADASGEMEEVFQEGLAEGLSESEAVRRANAVGAVYAPTSALLERIGLSKILKVGKNVPGKNRLVQVSKRIAEAGASEFLTEAAQTAASEVIQGVVTDDWAGVKELARTDELFRAGLSGAFLGGGIRAGVEALNPANYRSGKAFIEDAKAVAAEAATPASVGERPLVAGVALDTPGGGVGNVPQAEGVAAPEDGRTQQGGANNQAQPSPLPPFLQPNDPAQQQGEQTSGDGVAQQVVAAADGRNQSPQDGQSDAPGEVVADGDFVRVQGAPPISEPTLRRFTKANRVQSVRQVEPETPAQRRAVSFFAERNVPVYLVASPDGSPLRVPAMWSGDGVVIDANAGTPEYTRALVYHEAFHDLKRRNPTAWIRAYQAVRELDPDGLARAEAEYFGRADAAGVALDRDALSEDEALSTYAEAVSGWLEAARRDPAKMRRLAEQNPRTLARVLDAIQRAMRAVGFNVTPILERQGAERTAARIATELTTALDTLIGQPRTQASDMSTGRPAGRPETASAAQEAASEASTTASDMSTAPARPEPEARAVVRDRRGSEFSNRGIRRRLLEIVQSSPRTEQEYQDEFVDGGDQYGTELTFSFSGPLPTEIRQALQGEKANIRMMFRGNIPGANGADVMGAIGADAMVERARRMIQGRDSRIEQTFDTEGALDALSPDGGMLGTIRRLRGSLPASEIVPYEVVDNPGVLPEGATFRIQDSEFVVSRGEQGTRAVSMADPRQGFNLDGVASMPVDRRTLNRNAGAAVPEFDALADIPFAVRGTELTGYRDQPEAAIKELLRRFDSTGERATAVAALIHPQVGPIDFVYGVSDTEALANPSLGKPHGLAHLIDKHGGMGRSSVLVRRLRDARRDSSRDGRTTVVLTSPAGPGRSHVFVLAKSPSTGHWMVTAFTGRDRPAQRTTPDSPRRAPGGEPPAGGRRAGQSPADQGSSGPIIGNPDSEINPDLRFAVRPEPRGPVTRDLAGRPIFEPATGRQQQLPLETESPIAREDRERRERQARENGDDPGQQVLFALRDPESLATAAVEHFGVTEDAREAGFMLPDGRMLDLSGRHSGRRFRPGERAVSHTDLSESIGGGVDGLMAFMRDAGAVRMNMFDGSVHLAGPATEAQIARIAQDFADVPSFFVEIDADGTGQQRAFRRVDVPNRRSVARAIRDANRVLSGEIVPEDARFAIREPDPKAVSLLDALPDPPTPSRAQRKFFRRNSTEGMFNGIDPDPQTGFETMMFNFRRTMQDKFLPILRVQRAVERVGGRVSDEANAYRAETLYYGRAAEQSRQLNKRLVEPLFRKMTDAGIERGELDLYLYAKHAPERNRVIREKNPEFEGDGSGMSDADAAAIVARFENGNKGAAFKDLAADVGRIRDWTLAYMVQNDLLSEAQAQAWRDTYQNYVPLRTADTGRTPLSPGQGFQVRGKESKEALGRRSLADSPLLFLIHQADHTIVRAERNRVGLAFMRLIVGNPDKNLWNVYRRNVTRRTEPDMWGNTETEIVRNPAMPDLDQRNTIVVKEKGEERYLVVNNPDLVRAMKNMGTAQVPGALRVLGAFMRIRSSLVTTYSPEFMLTNFTRDIQTAAFNIGAEIDTATVSRVLGNVRKAMAGAWEATRAERRDSDAVEGEWAKTFREFVEDGGKTGWAGAYSFEDRAKDIARTIKRAEDEQSGILKALVGVKNLVEDANVAVENAVRVALYAELRRQGVSRAKAAETGKNLTVNFNRKGEAGTLLNTLYLFYNAGIQGAVRTLQAANTRRGRKIVLGIATSGVLMNFLNAFLSDEDDDGELFYDKISPWIKSHNLIVMLPGTGGRYLKIPLPYGYNVFHAFGTHTASAIRGEVEPGEAMAHVGASFLNSFNPIGGGLSLPDLSPEFAKPAVELGVNRNFADAPINPQRFPGDTRPDSEVFFQRSSLPAQWAAQFFNRLTGGDEVQAGAFDVHPGTIDHLLSFFTGAAGRFVKETFVDLPARVATGEGLEVSSTPFARRFLGEPAEQRHESRFWRNKGEADALLSFERRYLQSDEPGRVEAFRAREGVKLDAAREFRVYAKVINDLMERQAGGDDRVTDDEIRALRVEANRVMRAAGRGEAWETPLLDGARGVGRLRREERNRVRELEREAARR